MKLPERRTKQIKGVEDGKCIKACFGSFRLCGDITGHNKTGLHLLGTFGTAFNTLHYNNNIAFSVLCCISVS